MPAYGLLQALHTSVLAVLSPLAGNRTGVYTGASDWFVERCCKMPTVTSKSSHRLETHLPLFTFHPAGLYCSCGDTYFERLTT